MTVNGFTLDFCECAQSDVVRKPISAPQVETRHEDFHHRFVARCPNCHSAMAQAPKVKTIKANPANIYQSYSQGNQTFPNPDRDFQGEYSHSADYY